MIYLSERRMDVEEERSIYIPASHFSEMSLVPAETKFDTVGVSEVMLG